MKPAPETSNYNEPQLTFWETDAPKSPAQKRQPKSAAAPTLLLPQGITSKVGTEIIRGELNPSAWALALAESGGSHERAMTQYAKLRLEELSLHADHYIRKEEALEARRKAGFKKAPTPPKRPISESLPKPKTKNRRRSGIARLWLFGFWLGLSGTLAAASRYYSESSGNSWFRIDIGSSLLFAACLCLVPVLLHFAIPKSRFAIRQLLPLGAWATATASFMFGIMILSNRSGQSITLDKNILQVEVEVGAEPENGELPEKSIAAAR